MVGGRERCGKVLVVPSQCGPLSSFTLTMLCCVVAPQPVRHANRTKNSPTPSNTTNPHTPGPSILGIEAASVGQHHLNSGSQSQWAVSG